MTATRRIAVALVLACAWAASAIAGCSASRGAGAPSPGPDAGVMDSNPNETGTSDVSAPDAGLGASLPEAAVADAGAPDAEPEAATVLDGALEAATPFCAAEGRLSARCKPDGAICYDQNLSNCDLEGAIFSNAARQAYVDCEENLQCVTGLDFLSQPCVETQLLSASLTPAQMNLARDYCAVCTVDPNCYADFYQNGYVTGTNGPGFGMLSYNDDLVNFIDGRCLPEIPGDAVHNPCDFRFDVCIALALPGTLPLDNCKDGGP
jgi:hypothetical protein